jgi:hypothetical protein
MSKKQRRFQKRFEIEGEINKWKLRAKNKLNEAAGFDDTVANFLKEANVKGVSAGSRQFLLDQADLYRQKAILLRRRADVITETKVPALGRTLAAFQTTTLFKGDDQAVVLQR